MFTLMKNRSDDNGTETTLDCCPVDLCENFLDIG